MKWGKKLISLVVAIILGLSLFLAPVVNRVSPAQAAVPLTKDDTNPVFSEGVVSGAASVIYDSDEGIYKMWYTQATANLDNFDTLMSTILGFVTGDLIDNIKNLNFQAISNDDADDIKNIIDHLASLTISDLQTLLAGTGSVISYATSPDGISNWTFDSDVLMGDSGEWDEYYVGAPSVIKNGPDDYEMWYTGGKMDLAALVTLLDDLALLSEEDISTLVGDIADKNVAAFIADLEATLGTNFMLDVIDFIDGTGVAIGHATSTDGENWIKDANPVLPQGDAGAWDEHAVGAPSVIRNSDNDYDMWYTGFQINYNALLALLDAEDIDDIENILPNTINAAIGHATSPDGVNWTKDITNNPVLPKGAATAWDGYGVATPSVIKNSDNDYEMWYTGAKMVPNTLLDFLRGTSDLETALLNGTDSAIGYATSPDGVDWTKDTNNPVLPKGAATAWDGYGVGTPCVIKDGSTYKMWYTGGKSNPWTLILAILDGNDLALALANTNVAIGYASYSPPSGGGGGGFGLILTIDLTGVESSYLISLSGAILSTVERTTEDGELTIIIPGGTVILTKDGAAPIELIIAVDESPPPLPDGAVIIGTAYDFKPNGVTFDESMTLTFTYDPNNISGNVNEEDLVIAYYDLATGKWVELESVVDTEANTITAEVTHLTTFAVLGYKVAVPPVIPPVLPATFTLSSLSISPDEVDIDEPVDISILVTNTGGSEGSYEVILKIDDVVEATEEVTVSAGDSKEVTFTTSKDVAGTYSVEVSGLTSSFTVKEEVVPPPTFTLSSLSIFPDEVDIDEPVDISILVTNTGGSEGSYEVILKINDVVEATEEVTVSAGASKEVIFTVSKDAAGTYSVEVGGLTESFTVKEKVIPPVVPKPINWWLIGGIIAGVIAISIVIWQLIRQRA